MHRRMIRDRVLKLAEEVTQNMSVTVEDVEILGQKGRLTVRVVIDSPDGVSIRDCEMVSRQLEALLDIEDPIPGSYVLEVSSPGLDRPLKRLDDFKRFTGRLVRITTKQKIENQSFFLGWIRAVEDNDVIIQTRKKTLRIPYNLIQKANLEVEFNE